ncbi:MULTISPECIES: hypothetical protein [Pontibacillus]|uniref:LemA family protein n=1 Tax=Pontibacillus chungwhensis TaxID=265426 RepID=A0ABY8V1N6_9BACI|nr:MULTISPECIES: hypothetical protein [Pontibacillus]MCD5324160.1 hypothetical protein [Pontibacillus sp. HN14]WIF97781.1 hypothetical protein QNI29_18965 [Pontibacillus chungwhensis]
MDTERNNTQLDKEAGGEKKSNFFKTKSGTITIITTVIILIIAAFMYNNYRVAKEEEEEFNTYKEDFTVALSLLENEASKNLDVVSGTEQTWRDAIFSDEDIDFNTALILHLADLEENGTLKDLKSGRDKLDSKIQELQDVHPQFENVYDDFLDLYATYTQINDLAIEPTGSLQSYGDNYERLNGDFNQSYSTIKVRVPTELKGS